MSLALAHTASKIIAGMDSAIDRDLFRKVLRKHRAQVEQAQVEQAQVEQAQVEQAQVEQAQVEQRAVHPIHYIMNGAPACRPRSGHFWALLGEAVFAEWEALPAGQRCRACEKSRRVTFMRKQRQS